jgi:hypothetical protein
MYIKLRNLLDATAPSNNSAPKLGRGTLNIRMSRRISSVVAMIAASMMVIFGGVTAIAATSGNIVITTTNPNPPLDIETQNYASDAGVIGDQIIIKSNVALTGPVTATFAKVGGGTVPATVSPGGAGTFDTFTLTIPADATTGSLTVLDAAAHNGVVAPFGIWASRSEPYTMPSGHINLTYGDLKYILDQIKFGEAHAARTSNATTVVANSYSNLNALAIKAGTPLLYNNTNARSIYPYDVLSATRCLQAVDLTTAATANYGQTALSNGYAYSNLDPWGVRQVDGECNNITNVVAEAPTTYTNTVPTKTDTAGWGASDQFFSRLATATNKPGTTAPYTLSAAQKAYSNPTSYVKDAQPRLISNLISDQSSANPAAIAAGNYGFGTLYGGPINTEVSVNATNNDKISTVVQIPNVTADYNVSAGYDSWFTLFGQFFDHGLDLIPKGGSQVFIPLDQSDPLYVPSDTAKNYMVLTRGSDSTGEQINITSPYVDQSQTYGSVASQNAWLREYAFTGPGGAPVATGGLIEGTDFYTRGDQHLGQATAVNGASGIALNGGLATWWDIKNQAFRLGFQLTDWDAGSIPVLATNQYGKLITGTNGFPLMLFKNASNQYLWVEGNKNTPIWTFPQVTVGSANYGNAPGTLNGYYAVSTGHNFINDTMSSAVPAGGAGNKLIPDADNVINAPGSEPTGYYDNEALNEHFVAGDGRVNENIGLSAVHNTFHSEHNLLTQDIKNMLMNNPVIPASFLAEFLVNKNSTNASGDAAAGNWDGDRIYNAARYVCEMEYQHMVYDEFIRRISPGLPIFLAYQPTTRPDITQEFASAVYRLGHSMLNETIARSNPGTVWDPSNNQDVSLVTGFTNPSQARLARPAVISAAQANGSGNSIVYYLQTGTNEPLPEAGSVLSITGLTNSTLNIQNAVVASNNGSNTFTVNTYYQGGAASSPVSVNVAANASGSSKTYVLNTAANYDANWSTKEAQSTSGVVRVARASISNPGVGGYAYTPGESAAAIAQGMSQQRGNEIDEFTTDAVRNNLLGAPLDLPSLNLTRGRDTGLPTLNQFRATTGGALKPYKSWNDFIAALRYPESAVNFVAAYGTDPSISTKTIGSVTKVTSGPTLNTYTVSDIRGINVKDVVNISGFGTTARFNLQNAIVASVVDTDGNGPGNAGTFTVQKYYLTSPSAPTAFVKGAVVAGQDAGLTNLLKDVTPQALANVGTLSSTITKAGTVTRDTTLAERRAAAQVMMANGPFMSSTGAWALKETGYNNIDLWIGGLAENPAKQPLTPPMLGPTFQYVFDKQALALQNGDRFYYLGRILGTNLNEEIPAQQLTDIVRRNTPSAGNSVIQPAGTTGLVGMNSPGFSVSDCFFSPDPVVPNSIDNSQGGNDFANNGMGNTACPANTMRDDNTNNVWIHDGLDNVVGFGDQNSTTGIRIAGGAGDDSIQGTSGNDYLSGGASGGDLIYGYVGDDVLIGGPGEDLIKGGAGNDVLDMGESQAGDIADGNSGADFIHNSNSTGVAASAIGEAGDDYIQGGTNNDALLEGGEGSDWIEGAGGLDVLNGDAGPNAALVDMLNGGDDVMDGGAGNDLINSDGGDDVVNLGDGSDLVGLGTGFDWVNYEATTRFDNGPAAKPSVFIELAGGAIPNPTLMPVDAVLDSEGVSGSPGNDTIIGRQAQNQVLASTPTPITAASPLNAVYGKAGLSWLTINATATTIDGGMLVTGVGIPKGTQTVGPPALFTDATGLTTLQIILTSPLTANVTGNVSFKVWPLKRAAGVKGLSDLIAGTPGATVGSIVPLTVAGEWTGGTLMVGGAGNDKLYAMGGSNVIHGSVQLHTCIVVTHNGAPFDKNFDTTCEGRNGYSGMTPLLDFMNSGEVNPKDLRVVKELVSTAEPIIGISSSGGQITYTTTNNTYGVGDLVTVNGLATPAWNVNRAAITAVTANTFTVAVAAAATGGTVGVTGTAVQSDDLYLPGLAAAYTIERLSVLPLGATSGYKITGPTGIDYVYDVQRIVFDSLANATPTPLVLGNNPANAGNNTGFSAAATSLGITAGQLILSPAWDPSIHNYTAIASGASVTTAPTGTGSIWVNGLAKRGTTGTTTPTTLTLTGGAGTLVYNFGTATTNTYTVNIVAGGRVSTFDSPQSTGDGFTVNVTNCDKSQFTYTTSVPGGTASVGAQIGNNCEVTVSGLGTRQASTLAVTATPTATFGANPAGVGYVTGISSVGTAAPVVFDTPVGTNDGFTVNIISAVDGFTYLGEVVGTVDPANVSFGTIVNGVLPVTVTGMAPTEQGMLTVVASRTNFPTSSGSVLATAGGTIGAANVPTFGTPSSTGTGFTFHIDNYSALFDYSFSVQALTSTTADVDLSDLANGNVTVTGLANGEAAMVTVGTSRSGYADGASTITFGATNNPGTQPTVSAVTKTADGFTFDITNYDDNALHYSLSTTVGSVGMVSNQIGVATVTVTGLTPGQAASVTINYTEPLRAVATKVVSDTAQGGPALTPVIVAGTPLANGFTFRVTNYDPLYTWNVSATNGATVVGTPTVIGNTATYTMAGLNTNGTSVVTVETVRTNFGTGSATYTGTAFQSGLTVTRGATTKAATTTVQLANFDPTYTYVVSWSYTSALNVTTNGSAASISIATTGATAGRITITGVPAGARATGAVMRVNVTTSKQYFTTVLTTLTF